MIVVIDYGLGNIRSLMNWLKEGDFEGVLSNDRKVLRQASLLILPGVGAFSDAMDRLDNLGLKSTIIDLADKGVPIVGICLGMQLLYERSYEGGLNEGLALLEGQVLAFDNQLRVPQMGWNKLISKDLRFDGDYVYFIHSYYVSASDDYTVAYADYGNKVPAIVRKNNVLGFQFHPEKSGDRGREMLILIKELKDAYLSGN